jgi:uncharacterized protein
MSMPATDPATHTGNPPAVRSWISPKARKGGASAIEGRGLHAIESIGQGEVVAVKGGHIIDGATVASLPEAIRNSAFQFAEDHYLAALTQDEYEGVMMLANHSCEPNLGMGGNIVLVSMRDIAAGAELTIEYALFLCDDSGSVMRCRCGAATCRGMVTGTDWMRPDLQERYRGWFSWWLQRKIDEMPAAG